MAKQEALPRAYEAADVEKKWFPEWEKAGCFHGDPKSGKPGFSIVIPPPNVTGILTLGHVLNNTLQDILCRRARMKGFEVCWFPGTDHAGIATEARVVKFLKETENVTRDELGREEFINRVWKWKHEFGGKIIRQLRTLGCSCDWERERFTMDEGLSKAVQKVFIQLYNKGYIYRGQRMINWCPAAKSALSDEEVIYKDVAGKFYYFRYPLADGSGYLTVATTRPETMFGDTAVAVHPEDPRFKHLIGKMVKLPLTDREIPIVGDQHADPTKGTGCVKITPGHDPNDFEVGRRCNLEIINMMNPDATLNDKCPAEFVGMDRFAARELCVKRMEEAGLLEKIEDITHAVGYSERGNVPIETLVSAQWFCKMGELAKPAIDAVRNGDIKFYPERWTKTYFHWMENIQDWCISRQLWWGQRIPAYYLPDGQVVVASTESEALAMAQKIDANVKAEDLRQDEDVLDTWFSSWLWPISVFDTNKAGHPEAEPNKDLAYYYPTNDLVTGPDILFFWVARMIMAGNEFMNDVPFRNVYLTGIVRDKLGRKMSKTLGNSPDPLDLIAKYGADAVRLGMLLCSSAGNDILYDESQIEQGRNFNNKVWNAFRLVTGWTVDASAQQPEASAVAVKWFENKLSQVVETVEDHFSKFRISDALMTIYKFFWDDFCAWYLEAVKPAYGAGIDKATYDATIGFFDALLKMIHPIMPFITEELWQNMAERKPGETIMNQRYPQAKTYDVDFITAFEMACEAVAGVRNIRQSKNLSPREALELKVKGAFPSEVLPVVMKLANVTVSEAEGDMSAAQRFMVRTVEMFVPLTGLINVEEEVAKLEAELAYQQKFLDSVRKKLSNERFVANAPEAVVAVERKKEADSLSKIESITASLNALKNS